MRSHNLEKYSKEELDSKIKALKAINYILSLLIFMFLGYMFYVVYMGKWTDTNLAGIVSMTVLIAVIAMNSGNISRLKKELGKR